MLALPLHGSAPDLYHGKWVAGLFASGEQGVWYDPSDLSTLFQDAAGTTPVTAVEQPVGRMLDKSGRGNHARQVTTASRPVLSARVNLLTKSEDFSPGTWFVAYSALTTNVTPAPDGTSTAYKFSPNAGVTFNNQIATTGFWYSAYPFISQPAAVEAGAYVYRLRVKAAGFDVVQLRVAEANTLTGANQSIAAVNLNTGVIPGIAQTGNLTNTSASCIRSEEGWCDIRLSFTSGAAQTLYFGIWVQNTTQTTGDGVNGLDLWGADLRPANQAHLPYQRVNTSTDYDTAGFPMYLRFDGVDDWLVTNSINFTGTDKMTVFAGVRKLSDAAGGFVAELSAERAVNNGAWSLIAPGGVGVRQGYYFSSKGTLDSANGVDSGYAPPITNILTGLGDISGDLATLRVNGTQAASRTADQGTGNYGNYPLYIGRRGGTELPFKGRLYGLIVRGAQTDDAHLTHAEKYLAYKSGVTL